MPKRLLIGLAPLLAVAAFAVMPVAAQAAGPQWYVCQKVTLKTGKFTKINCAIEKAESNFEKVLIGNLSSAVLVVSKHVAGHKAVLRAPKIASGIECEIVKDESWLWNSRMRGRDINEIEFSKCKGFGGLEKCTVAEPIIVEAATRLKEVAGKIYNEYSAVSGEPLTEWTLSGAECPAPGTNSVTGTVMGEIAAGGGKFQKFNAGELTLEYLGEKAEFEGETEQEGAGGEGVFVK